MAETRSTVRGRSRSETCTADDQPLIKDEVDRDTPEDAKPRDKKRKEHPSGSDYSGFPWELWTEPEPLRQDESDPLFTMALQESAELAEKRAEEREAQDLRKESKKPAKKRTKTAGPSLNAPPSKSKSKARKSPSAVTAKTEKTPKTASNSPAPSNEPDAYNTTKETEQNPADTAGAHGTSFTALASLLAQEEQEAREEKGRLQLFLRAAERRGKEQHDAIMLKNSDMARLSKELNTLGLLNREHDEKLERAARSAEKYAANLEKVAAKLEKIEKDKQMLVYMEERARELTEKQSAQV